MDKKDFNKLEKIYASRGDDALTTFDDIEEAIVLERDVYLNEFSDERKRADFEEAYAAVYQLNCLEKNSAEEFVREVSLGSYDALSELLTNGIYHAYKNEDISILKDALHTYNRLNYSRVISTCTGYNQAGVFEDVIYAFADCDITLVKRLMPQAYGLADNQTHSFLRVGYNLVLAMVYGNASWLTEAQQQATKFIQQKSSAKSDVLVIQYLYALSNQDVVNATCYLQAITDNYRKMTWLFEFKNDCLKFFAAFVHGLYHIAHFTLSDALFIQLEIPNHSVFWKEFNEYTHQVSFLKGKSIFTRKDGVEGWNKLFE